MEKHTEHFAQLGFGWICIACTGVSNRKDTRSRLMDEGEAESKEPRLSQQMMAKWSSPEKTGLYCPNCGIHEELRD